MTCMVPCISLLCSFYLLPSLQPPWLPRRRRDDHLQRTNTVFVSNLCRFDRSITESTIRGRRRGRSSHSSRRSSLRGLLTSMPSRLQELILLQVGSTTGCASFLTEELYPRLGEGCDGWGGAETGGGAMALGLVVLPLSLVGEVFCSTFGMNNVE